MAETALPPAFRTLKDDYAALDFAV